MASNTALGGNGGNLVIPQKGLLDYLTRTDDLVIENIKAIKVLIDLVARTSQRGPTGPGGFGSIEFKQKLLNAEYKPYVVQSYPLDTALTNKEITIDGQAIQAWTNGSFVDCGVRLNNKDECNLILFENFNPIVGFPFHKIFLTTIAQAGKTMRLLISKEPFTALSLSELETTLVQKFWILRSDKDTHFTGAIVQNATEEENITGLITNTIRITGVAIQSDQQLDYRVILFGTDGFADTNLDLDYLESEVELDLLSYGWRIAGANQYYMAVTGLSIDYEDLDATKELHVALQNLSATAKNAGATGEVVVAFTYEERE